MPICYGLIGISRTGSVYLTVSVTLERYFAIVRPLAPFRIKKYLLIMAITLAIAYNIPRFFELERDVFPLTNETMVVGTELRRNEIYNTYYLFWSKIIILEMIPYFTIVILNALIIKQILGSQKFRKSCQESEMTTTITTTNNSGLDTNGATKNSGTQLEEMTEVEEEEEVKSDNDLMIEFMDTKEINTTCFSCCYRLKPKNRGRRMLEESADESFFKILAIKKKMKQQNSTQTNKTCNRSISSESLKCLEEERTTLQVRFFLLFKYLDNIDFNI